VVPADHKWFSHISTFAILLKTMQQLDPRYPELDSDNRADLATIRKQLIAGE
jgi:hypothetical protein